MFPWLSCPLCYLGSWAWSAWISCTIVCMLSLDLSSRTQAFRCRCPLLIGSQRLSTPFLPCPWYASVLAVFLGLLDPAHHANFLPPLFCWHCASCSQSNSVPFQQYPLACADSLCNGGCKTELTFCDCDFCPEVRCPMLLLCPFGGGARRFPLCTYYAIRFDLASLLFLNLRPSQWLFN